MVQTTSVMQPLGTSLPAFQLKDTRGATVSTSDYAGQPLLIIVMCNHCPFVKHVRAELVQLAAEYQERGVAVLAINANINPDYPADGPEKMAEDVARYGYSFPYLIDEDQGVAKALHAACTPDFFLYDREHKLVYRGRLDQSRPGNDVPVTGRDLRQALDALLEGKAIAELQTPSLGCNIKWRPGNEPDYFQG